MGQDFRVAPERPLRLPVHASITPEQVSRLVDDFYSKVQSDNRLASIFGQRVADDDWPAHLNKMKTFWRSVLLRSGEYKGKPVPAHAPLVGIIEDDFRQWLGLFRTTVVDVFEEPAQPLVMATAERIASSLWLARSSDLFAAPPDWSIPKGEEP